MKLLLFSPFYLIHGQRVCPACSHPHAVIAIGTKDLVEHETGEADELIWEHGQLQLLTYTTHLPPIIQDYLQTSCPTFDLRTTVAGGTYFTNSCSRCGQVFGDHHIHDRPGSVYFPCTREEAMQLARQKLPFEGAFEFASAYTNDSMSLIETNARVIV
jgi:hypothetical protein